MTKAYIPTNGSLKELQTVIETVQKLGLDKQHTYIGGTFDTFAKNLAKGDTALVHSLATFNSITQILAKTIELNEKGVTLKSLAEPWFNNPKTTSQELIKELFKLGAEIHTPTTDARTQPAKQRVPIIDKVRNAKRLNTEHQMPIAKACKLSNCTLLAYHTYAKKLD